MLLYKEIHFKSSETCTRRETLRNQGAPGITAAQSFRQIILRNIIHREGKNMEGEGQIDQDANLISLI